MPVYLFLRILHGRGSKRSYILSVNDCDYVRFYYHSVLYEAGCGRMRRMPAAKAGAAAREANRPQRKQSNLDGMACPSGPQ